LLKFGPATKVSDGRSYAHDPHDVARRLEAKKHLSHKPVSFVGLQARAVASGFHRFVQRSGLIIHACSILPEHVHLVVLRHRFEIERVASHLKADATSQLIDEGLHPFAGQPYRNGKLPSPGSRGQWKCYIFDRAYLRNAISYVERNPIREGMKAQNWNFVTPFMD
jgi:REP element-mobilizing transposase RayT